MTPNWKPSIKANKHEKMGKLKSIDVELHANASRLRCLKKKNRKTGKNNIIL